MTGDGLPEQTVGMHAIYLSGKLSVFWNKKVTGEVIPEQTVGTDVNYFYG
jgi:hypothetical protein